MQQAVILEVVKSLNKPTLAKIITRTLVRMNKFSKDKSIANPYKRVYKVSTLIVELNPAYETSVNQQRIVENKPADFVAESHTWGKHVGHGIFERNGKTYISVISKRVVMVNHLTRDALIEKSEIETFLPKQSKTNKQNLDNLVAYRTFSVDNILSIQLLDSIQPEDDKAIKTNKSHNERPTKLNHDTKTITVKQHFDNFFCAVPSHATTRNRHAKGLST